MNHEIHTLHEFMMQTKAVSYLLAVVFLAVLTFLWFFLKGGENEE